MSIIIIIINIINIIIIIIIISIIKMALFDVESLFTNIPLDESIELVVKYIDQGNPGLMMSSTDIKTFFPLATACRD